MPPAKRRRLQMCFEQGNKVGAAGQFDYATDMFIQCIVGDPGNPIYTKSFLSNLQKKYNQNKKGAAMAGFKTAGNKAAIKKSIMQKDWLGVIKTGLDVLKVNPWDGAALLDIGQACEQLTFYTCQLEYLRIAFEGDQNDVSVLRAYAKALGKTGSFDQAIAIWDRVLKNKPTDEEAQRAKKDLSVEKTISKGGYDTASTTKEVRSKMAQASEGTDEDARLTPAERLQRAIDRNPTDLPKYMELNDIYQRDEKYDEAEALLTKALEVSGGDVVVREKLEDTQLRRARQAVDIAERRARAEKTEQAVNLFNQMRADLLSKEIQVYAGRVERYPTNIGYKFELGRRLKQAKKYTEAIKLLQECRTDLKRKGIVFFNLGECFAQIKQYKLAIQSFEMAAQEIQEKDIEQKKEALYLAGKIAVHVKDIEAAEKHLGALAGLDFGYKDVAQWLDKLAKLREDGPDALEE